VQYYGFVLFREGDLYAQLNNARLFYDTVGSHLALGADRMEVRPTLIALHGGPGFDHAPMRPYFRSFISIIAATAVRPARRILGHSRSGVPM
jgi:proline iminopeptidase